MKYKINELAKMAGISTRTLRYYDQIGLLVPHHNTDTSYRIYTENEVNRLQQILLYKNVGIRLLDIKKLLDDSIYDPVTILENHQESIKASIRMQQELLQTISQTIKYHKGEKNMRDEEKFKGLKENIIQENEKAYGTEIREKYGENTVNESYQKMRKMSKWEFNRANELGEKILEELKEAIKQNNPGSSEMQHVCQLHQEWIKLYWPVYSTDAHLQLVQMYTVDERFKQYYDVVGEGATELLYQAMQIYIKKDN